MPLAQMSSEGLADLITHSDTTDFRELSIQSIMKNDKSFRNFGLQWNMLSLAVVEAVNVDQNSALKALKVAKAS